MKLKNYVIAWLLLGLVPAMATAQNSAVPGGAKPAMFSLPAVRLPAVPLVAHDPYFSVWSFNDALTDGWTRHWTGAVNAFCGLIRIDGKTYRFSGQGRDAALSQKSVVVLPTRSVYTFEQDGVQFVVTFLTPALPDDLDLISRPVTYVTYQVTATDGKPHSVTLYTDVTGEWVTDRPDQTVEWSRFQPVGLDVLRIGTAEQKPLNRAGDNLRIDWGHLYVAVPHGQNATTTIASDRTCREGFGNTGTVATGDDLRMPRRASDEWPVLATVFPLGEVTATPQTRRLMLAYDERLAIEYLRRPLPPYWKRSGKDIGTLLVEANKDYATLEQKAAEFDAKLVGDASSVGGAKYAALCAASYRQCLAAHKLVADADGTPLYFSKENFSNGCIATVDVTYPSAPLFLLMNPTLLKGMLTPMLDYAGSPRWKFPFAPHDLGTYPLANGQVYGGGERSEEDQMPVEECGNLLILVSALTLLHEDKDYLNRYYPLLRTWAEYLMQYGYDPENQLCTDDFAGHLAHNTNLSLKAIVALGAFGRAAEGVGKKDDARRYTDAAKDRAKRWTKDADDGDHYRLTFDGPNTWSQKYNLVWDRLLNLNLFPADVAKKEMAFYRTRQNKYGLPLDNRRTYTKLDWILWSACLTGERADFDALMEPIFLWMNETPSRVPLTDWYETTDGKQVGFQARSVVGGVFLKMLFEPSLRTRYRLSPNEK